MDRERLGRVLGRGARLAAKTAFEAVDAATATPPAGPSPRRQASTRAVSPVTAERPTQAEPIRPEILRPSRAGRNGSLLRAAKAAGTGFAGPLRRASRALWLELTGCFFALFALSFGLGVWHTRGEWKSAIPVEEHRAEAFCLLTLVFLYFSVSSFLRARRAA